ncbi:CDGSH iron-sulfur domain-containing protein [soil metagenome]
MSRRAYRSQDITVSFDPGRCIHSAECIHGLPEVFDVEKRPWIQPEESDPDTVAEVVMRCPTGALQFARKDGGHEEPAPGENIVSVGEDGPLYVRGDVEIKDNGGTTFLEDTRIALCRCGESQNKPFCDNSHKSSGFRHDGTVDRRLSSDTSSPIGGRLDIKLTPNGPLFLKGEFEIRDRAGDPAGRTNQAALCRCGYSGAKPFCDGSHSEVGWRDD